MSTVVPEIKEMTSSQVTNSQQQKGSATQGAPPAAVLTQLITGSLGAQALYVAAKLGIADCSRTDRKMLMNWPGPQSPTRRRYTEYCGRSLRSAYLPRPKTGHSS